MLEIQIIIAVIASSGFSVFITWLFSMKKNKAAINNTVADTAEKIVRAASETIEHLTKRVAKLEAVYEVVKAAQLDCEIRESRLNVRVSSLENENNKLRKFFKK